MSDLLRRRALAIDNNAESDPWEALITSITSGTYATKYSIGDTIPMAIGSYDQIEMQIVAFDADTLASDSNKTAAVSLLAKQILTNQKINASGGAGISGKDASHYNLGLNGWPSCDCRYWLRETLLPAFPPNVKNAIKEVVKTYYSTKDGNVTLSYNDTIWLPSFREIGLGYESSGPIYAQVFSSNAARVRAKAGTADRWWTRSSPWSWGQIAANGQRLSSAGSNGAGTASGMVIGFCL